VLADAPPLSLLLVEDSPEDAEILLHHLTKAGLRIAHLRVDTAAAMAKALTNGLWDLVLSDYSLPGFNGMQALELLQAAGIDIPFILVSGTIGEEVAVHALKAGAHDFMTKGNLTRLVPAIQRELKEASERQQRRSSEASLQELREQLIAIGEAASDAILMTNSHFHITYWNPMAERMFGYPQDYAKDQDLFKLVLDPTGREEFQRLFQDTLHLDAGPTLGRTTELTGRNKDGWEILLEVSLSTVLLGGRWNLVAILRDITQRKAIERDWMEQLHFFQTVLETIPNPVYYKDAEGRYLGCNQAFGNFVGLRKDEVIGKTLRDLAPPALAPPHLEADQEVLRGRNSLTYEVEVVHADGTARTVIESKAPFFDIEGRVTGLVGTMQDITDRRHGELEKAKLEVQLRQAQKLEAIGQLAAGIAHEINTPTQFIGDNTIFLRDAFKDLLAFLQWQRDKLAEAGLAESGREAELPALFADCQRRIAGLDLDYILDEIPKAISQTLDGVTRVARIVGAMKDFSHPGMEAKMHVDLNHSIESTLIISHNEWKYLTEVEPDYDPALPPVPCYPGEFNQVILNLVVNAAHAIEEAKAAGRLDRKGLIRISTRREGNEAVIRIEDNGIGIPEAIRTRIFEPFFTTKKLGKGTGQGLAIAHAVIVDKHKGRLSLESEVGKGTTFTIALPMDADPESKKSS
jgi:two-component system NtrC family sensor kinase